MITYQYNVKLVKPKKRYVLMFQGYELTPARRHFNEKMCWKLKSAAEDFIKYHNFYCDDMELPKEFIEIKEVE